MLQLLRDTTNCTNTTDSSDNENYSTSNTTNNTNCTISSPFPNPGLPSSDFPSALISQIVSYSIETLSIIGCIVVFSIYLTNVKSRNLSLRLLIYLAVLFLLGGTLDITNDIFQNDLKSSDMNCQIIGLYREILNLSAMILIVYISWFMKKSAQNELEQAQKNEKLLLFIAIFIPAGVGIG